MSNLPVKEPNLYSFIKGLFHIHLRKVYSIREEGRQFCPKGKTYAENLSNFDPDLNECLRYLCTGPKSDSELFEHFSPRYTDRRITGLLKIAEYLDLIQMKRTITMK